MNSVVPLGALAPFWYLDTNPKDAFPTVLPSGAHPLQVHAPLGESNQPPPVTHPPLGSKTTMNAGWSPLLERVPLRSPSLTLMVTVYTPGVVNVCDAAAEPAPADSVTLPADELPSSHETFAVWVSPGLASVNDAVRLTLVPTGTG